MEEAVIFVFDAEVGMTLAKDVITPNGHILVKKDTVLDWDLISNISNHHVLEIKVYVNNDTTYSDVPFLQESEETVKYYDNIRQSETFKNFEEEFVNSVSEVKEELENVINFNKDINTSKLLEGPLKLLKSIPNNLQLLDMIHSIRQYDDLTYVHCVSVSLLASTIGRWLNYNEEKIRLLALAGIVHDVGKLQIPIEILTKPGRLTDNEYTIMKKHVNLGYEALKNQNIDQRIKEAVLLHHERCDGSGYPFGLKNEMLPLEAKIITVADVYDAMTANRVYRKAICPFSVVDIMYKESFSKYDPTVAITFLRNIVTSYIHTDVRLSDGSVGKVILVNENDLSRPTVLVGKRLIDLSRETNLEIVALIN